MSLWFIEIYTRGGTGGGALHFYERGQKSHLLFMITLFFCAIVHFNYPLQVVYQAKGEVTPQTLMTKLRLLY